MAVIIPPIKSQGTRQNWSLGLTDIINQSGIDLSNANWIEPFWGTGVVGLNSPVGGHRIVGDNNPPYHQFL